MTADCWLALEVGSSDEAEEVELAGSDEEDDEVMSAAAEEDVVSDVEVGEAASEDAVDEEDEELLLLPDPYWVCTVPTSFPVPQGMAWPSVWVAWVGVVLWPLASAMVQRVVQAGLPLPPSEYW